MTKHTNTYSLHTELFQLSQSSNGRREGGKDIVGQTEDSEAPKATQPFREGGEPVVLGIQLYKPRQLADAGL